ncbi:restriction endonuclease [Altererythrobacter sp. Root672]|uniref:restriction endonuclease n=1 Tax=Altererythrobacter sp. Root672 TaxID=1736584 RepID=UPI0006F6C2DC|nr:restriction endonuclease [Altererythrobacter sp. Root672]KRA79719.1 hypothetical protein ASD76_16985 [Altererythrobacter sp. Root672]
MATITIRSNNIENITLGELRARYNVRGDRILRYHLDLSHTAMKLHRELSAPEIFILQSKVDALIASWDEKFAAFRLRQIFKSGKDQVDDETAAAGAQLENLKHILARTLAVNDEVDWAALKDQSAYDMPRSFPEPQPRRSETSAPEYRTPTIGLLDVVLGRKARKLAEAEGIHADQVRIWHQDDEQCRHEHESATREWQERERAFWNGHEEAQRTFLTEQAERNAIVDRWQEAVGRGDPEAVIEHATLVLDASDYDGLFEKSFAVQYRPDEQLLMMAYDLPSPDELPRVHSVRFVKTTGEMKIKEITEREQKANFESVAYQVCLRTLHELFEADVHGNIGSILFNGHVDFVDKRTGQDARSCLLSVLVRRDEFTALDLSRVEPKACFKSLKGVSAASLASFTAIPPVLEMDQEDRRFVNARRVSLEEGTNLASMPWEDFEHLIRELFEKEFSARGGEVKVTQASRDGGVDAIAFDPDPISGGKIVIQAKRYTRTVGLSAVRDLFGTVMNEGATKGILVTTSDYGPDAYQFASGKPLTLLSGGNLLHLLERHGYRARINLAEARETATV